MPIYDHECECGRITEGFARINETTMPCVCGGTAKRILSVRGQYCGNQDAPWIRSVLEVVDKESKAPHVQNFVRNPTRENYKAWMKGENIKPADYTVKGGPPVLERPKKDTRAVVDEVYRRHKERKSLSISS